MNYLFWVLNWSSGVCVTSIASVSQLSISKLNVLASSWYQHVCLKKPCSFSNVFIRGCDACCHGCVIIATRFSYPRTWCQFVHVMMGWYLLCMCTCGRLSHPCLCSLSWCIETHQRETYIVLGYNFWTWQWFWLSLRSGSDCGFVPNSVWVFVRGFPTIRSITSTNNAYQCRVLIFICCIIEFISTFLQKRRL